VKLELELYKASKEQEGARELQEQEERAHGDCVSICGAFTGEFFGLHEPALLLYCCRK
jgi:hypothetical protein